jgi:oxygen-independent coproporphyrinogen III oxidase
LQLHQNLSATRMTHLSPITPAATPDGGIVPKGNRAASPATAVRRGTEIAHLYVHVPFCARKCDYCAFYSEADLSSDLTDRYVQALIRELGWAAQYPCRPETIFFGGGTPTLLTLRQWETILQACHRLFPESPAEWTVECNPATLSLDKARLLRQGGVNRISMGVQSLDDELLDRLGRVHSRDTVFRSFDLLRRAGFDNLNLDLMFAIPGQTLEVWRATLAEAVAMGSEHLSCYEVIYEDDTPLFHQLKAGEVDLDEDLACQMYETLQATAAEHRFEQYEVANFARRNTGDPGAIPTRACRHNVNTWRGGSYLGLGPSASSFANGVRSHNAANTQLYCEQIEQGRRPVASQDVLSPLARAGEIAAFGLRMVVGWSFDEFQQRTGFDLRDHWADDLDALAQRGWAEHDAAGIRLTRQGLRFADAAAQLLLRNEREE